MTDVSIAFTDAASPLSRRQAYSDICCVNKFSRLENTEPVVIVCCLVVVRLRGECSQTNSRDTVLNGTVNETIFSA